MATSLLTSRAPRRYGATRASAAPRTDCATWDVKSDRRD
jgi:hypothetical protein